jgi:hypothetical protein
VGAQAAAGQAPAKQGSAKALGLTVDARSGVAAPEQGGESPIRAGAYQPPRNPADVELAMESSQL